MKHNYCMGSKHTQIVPKTLHLKADINKTDTSRKLG